MRIDPKPQCVQRLVGKTSLQRCAMRMNPTNRYHWIGCMIMMTLFKPVLSFSRLSSSPLSRRQGLISLFSSTAKDETHHTITWKTPNGDPIVFQAQHGELLRTAALRSGLASPHNDQANLINCRGLGTCGTCAVQIDGCSTQRNAVESLRLSLPPGHGAENAQRLRLACQVMVQEDLVLSKYNGFWGQYDELVHPSVPTQPFGAAEFVLDRTSPPPKE